MSYIIRILWQAETMKNLILIISIIFYVSCSKGAYSDESKDGNTASELRCGTHNGKQLWIGPKGGCYYKNSNGNKTYVERAECNC